MWYVLSYIFAYDTQSYINTGNCQNGISVLAGAQLSVDAMRIRNLMSVGGALFRIDGTNTMATIAKLVVSNIDMSSASTTWYGVRAQSGSMYMIMDSEFINLKQLSAILTAEAGSKAMISTVKIDTATGVKDVSADVSSAILVNSNAMALVDNVVITAYTLATMAIFVNGGSDLVIASSCLVSGSTDGAVYLSDDSTSSIMNNYVSDDYMSINNPLACPGPGPNRLILEDPGSMCFAGSDNCTTTCALFREVDTCAASFSKAPTVAPTNAPSSPTTRVPSSTFRPTTRVPSSTNRPTVSPLNTRSPINTIPPESGKPASPTGTRRPSSPPNIRTNAPTRTQQPTTADTPDVMMCVRKARRICNCGLDARGSKCLNDVSRTCALPRNQKKKQAFLKKVRVRYRTFCRVPPSFP